MKLLEAPEFWSCVVSVMAFIASMAAIVVSVRANTISSTDGLVAQVLKHLEEEMLFALQDFRLYRTICTTPFDEISKKDELAHTLHDARDHSRRRIQALTAIVGQASTRPLVSARAELECDDSFIDNLELALSDKTTSDAVAKYEQAYETYAHALRQFARTICERKWLKKPKAAK